MGTAYPHLTGVTTGRKEQAAAEHAQRRAWYRGERMLAAVIARRRRIVHARITDHKGSLPRGA